MRQHVHGKHIQWIKKFEEDHAHSIKSLDFSSGDLVLAWNTRVEKTFSTKNRMWYMGPLLVICRNRGGAYIVAELNGTLWRRPVGAFRLIPYRARLTLPVPNIEEFIDIPTKELERMEESNDCDYSNKFPFEDFPPFLSIYVLLYFFCVHFHISCIIFSFPSKLLYLFITLSREGMSPYPMQSLIPSRRSSGYS
ncbi:hypothetical protein BDP27DRAFT_1239415 [Rhodocollybia butyracea]|uniref:Uncharacterized protein n=1 Tax=Rhodocollybia butyracea TaxID=206335 RepID=A0A9P5TYA7_9AGAR|nr:hypothetical protein BDP27DRAFT_1239415 [Rhodocollybia butyracea]